MKIGIDVRCFAGGRVSGVEEYARHLIECLIESSSEHDFVLFFNTFSKKTIDFSWATRYKNVRLHRTYIPNKILNFSLWYFQRPFLDTFIGGVDVFFAPNMTFIALSRKCRFVITAHDLSFEVYPESFSFKRRLWHLFVAPRKLFRRAQKIIAVSSSTKEDLVEKYKIQKGKIEVIPSGVSDAFFPMDRNDLGLMEIKKHYKLPYRYILFMGAFEPRKNIITLLRAYEMFRRRMSSQGGDKPPELILAGSSGWKESEIMREIRKHPYRKDIRRIGFVSEKDKIGLYNLATVFVYPSLYEGFGFPVLEAMKCGIPVIVSNNSSLGEIGRDGALYVDPFRPEEIALLCEELFGDIAFRYEMAKKVRMCASRFSWRDCVQKTKEILTQKGK